MVGINHQKLVVYYCYTHISRQSIVRCFFYTLSHWGSRYSFRYGHPTSERVSCSNTWFWSLSLSLYKIYDTICTEFIYTILIWHNGYTHHIHILIDNIYLLCTYMHIYVNTYTDRLHIYIYQHNMYTHIYTYSTYILSCAPIST